MMRELWRMLPAGMRIRARPVLRPIEAIILRHQFLVEGMQEDTEVYNHFAASAFRPKSVSVQISRRCNLNCSMCGWEIWQRNEGTMSPEIFRRVIQQMKDFNVPLMQFTAAQGEPLLNPRAKDFITMAMDAGIDVIVNTNCTTLGKRNVEMLAEAAKRENFLKLQASFSGYDKVSHENIYVGSKFEDTSRKLKACYEAFANAGMTDKFLVHGIIRQGDKQKHLDYLASLGIPEKLTHIHYPDNFAGIIKIDRRRNSYRTDDQFKLRSLRLCSTLIEQLVVYDDGEVSACACRDSENVMNIGNIKTQTLFEMRNGPKFKEMVNAFMARNIKKMPLCAKCDIPYGRNSLGSVTPKLKAAT
jgi:radical SAM protein with 4Fe4S-binding SPASM domain